LKTPPGIPVAGVRKVEARIREICVRFEDPEPPRRSPEFVEVLKKAEKQENPGQGSSPVRGGREIPGYGPPEGGPGRIPPDILESMILRKSREHGVDGNLIRAVIQMESGGKANVVSSAGAMGLMQLMPSTARMLGVENAFDPEQNIDGGVRYLQMMLERFNGDEKLALAAYHSGPGRVEQYGGIPPFPIVNRYVKTVSAIVEKLRRE
jgi:hypothetical protein